MKNLLTFIFLGLGQASAMHCGPLADALHSISSHCVSKDAHYQCSLYSKEMMSQCSSKDLNCQRSKLAGIHDYCRQVCHNTEYVSDSLRHFLSNSLHSDQHLLKRGLPEDESGTALESLGAGARAEDTENQTVADGANESPEETGFVPVFSLSGISLSSVTENKDLNEFIGSAQIPQGVSDLVEDKLRPAVAKIKENIRTGLDATAKLIYENSPANNKVNSTKLIGEDESSPISSDAGPGNVEKRALRNAGSSSAADSDYHSQIEDPSSQQAFLDEHFPSSNLNSADGSEKYLYVDSASNNDPHTAGSLKSNGAIYGDEIEPDGSRIYPYYVYDNDESEDDSVAAPLYRNVKPTSTENEYYEPNARLRYQYPTEDAVTLYHDLPLGTSTAGSKITSSSSIETATETSGLKGASAKVLNRVRNRLNINAVQNKGYFNATASTIPAAPSHTATKTTSHTNGAQSKSPYDTIITVLIAMFVSLLV